MPRVVDRFNVDGEDYTIQPVIDPVPTQGSGNAVASGGVYDAIQPVVNKGDTGAVLPPEAQGLFTRKGAYDYSFDSEEAGDWLAMVFGPKLFEGTSFISNSVGLPNVPLTRLAYVRGVWIIGTEQGGMYWADSYKGPWTLCSGANSSLSYYLTANGNERFAEARGYLYTIGYVGGTPELIRSLDGKTWLPCTYEGVSFSMSELCIFDTGSILVMSGFSDHPMWSENGVDWYNGTGDASGGLVSYNGSIFVTASYSNGSTWSEDGKVWTQGTGLHAGQVADIEYGNGVFVARVSDTPNAYLGLFYSEDGKTWTQCSGTVATTWSAGYTRIAHYNFYYSEYFPNYHIWYFGSIDSGLWYSADGKSWSQCTGITGNPALPYYINRRMFVSARGGLFYSNQGNFTSFTQVNNVPAITTGVSNNMNHCPVFYVNGSWVTLRNDKMYKSANATDWSDSGSSCREMTTAYHAGVLAGVSNGYRVAYSGVPILKETGYLSTHISNNVREA